jgi:hypothetical protein
MERLLDREVDMAEVEERLIANFVDVFEIQTDAERVSAATVVGTSAEAVCF